MALQGLICFRVKRSVALCLVAFSGAFLCLLRQVYGPIDPEHPCTRRYRIGPYQHGPSAVAMSGLWKFLL